jgi:type I restriction enzyme R subunit
MELIKQVETNVVYILQLIEKYQETNCKDKEILINIQKALLANPSLRNKIDLINEFIEKINVESNLK